MTQTTEGVEDALSEFAERFVEKYGPTAGDAVHPYPVPTIQAWLRTALTAAKAQGAIEALEKVAERLPSKIELTEPTRSTEANFVIARNTCLDYVREVITKQQATYRLEGEEII